MNKFFYIIQYLRVDLKYKFFRNNLQFGELKCFTSSQIGKDDYVINIIQNNFPHKISDQKFNDFIKIICCESGIVQETTGELKNKNNRLEVKKGPKWMFISSHDLRRSFATNHFYKGVPVSLLMQITGHRRESTFFDYIGHKFTKDQQAKAFLNYL